MTKPINYFIGYLMRHLHGIMLGITGSLLIIPFFFSYLLSDFFEITPKQLFEFVSSGNPSAFNKSVRTHLEARRSFFDSALRVSSDRASLISQQINAEYLSNFGLILDISNRDRDIIRFSLVLADISKKHLKADGYPGELHELLDGLSDAYMEIQRAEVKKDGKVLVDERRYINAVSILENVYEGAHGKYPEIELEALRDLSFCEFVLGRMGKASLWRRKALDLRRFAKPSFYEYKWKWFWVDFNDLILSLREGDLANADKAFKRLTRIFHQKERQNSFSPL